MRSRRTLTPGFPVTKLEPYAPPTRIPWWEFGSGAHSGQPGGRCMATTSRCSQGHRWEAHTDEPAPRNSDSSVCPVCGGDRNQNNCGHKVELEESPFAALKSLKLE